jgi:hypothetical protein
VKTRPAWPSRRECASPLPAPIVLSRSAVRANWDRSLTSAGSLRKPPTGGPSPLVTPSAVRRRATSPGAGHAATCLEDREPYRVRNPRGSCTGGLTGRSAHFYGPRALVQAMDGDRCGRQGRSYDSAHAPSQIAAAATEPVDDALGWCILLMRAAGARFGRCRGLFREPQQRPTCDNHDRKFAIFISHALSGAGAGRGSAAGVFELK